MKDQRSLEFTRDHAKMRRIYAGGKGPPYPGSRRGVGNLRKEGELQDSVEQLRPATPRHERSSRKRDAMHVILAAAPGRRGCE